METLIHSNQMLLHFIIQPLISASASITKSSVNQTRQTSGHTKTHHAMSASINMPGQSCLELYWGTVASRRMEFLAALDVVRVHNSRMHGRELGAGALVLAEA